MKDLFIQRPNKKSSYSLWFKCYFPFVPNQAAGCCQNRTILESFFFCFLELQKFRDHQHNFVINSTIALMPCFWWNWLYFYIYILYPNKIHLIYVLYTRISVRNRIIFIIFFDDGMIHTQSLAQLFCLSNDVNEWKLILRIV